MHQSRPPVVAVAVVDVETLPVATEADTGAAVVDIAFACGDVVVAVDGDDDDRAVVEIVVVAVDRQVVAGTRVAVHCFLFVAPLLERKAVFPSEHRWVWHQMEVGNPEPGSKTSDPLESDRFASVAADNGAELSLRKCFEPNRSNRQKIPVDVC